MVRRAGLEPARAIPLNSFSCCRVCLSTTCAAVVSLGVFDWYRGRESNPQNRESESRMCANFITSAKLNWSAVHLGPKAVVETAASCLRGRRSGQLSYFGSVVGSDGPSRSGTRQVFNQGLNPARRPVRHVPVGVPNGKARTCSILRLKQTCMPIPSPGEGWSE